MGDCAYVQGAGQLRNDIAQTFEFFERNRALCTVPFNCQLMFLTLCLPALQLI